MRLHQGNKRGSNPNLNCNIDSPNSKDQFKTKFTIRVTKRIEVTLTLKDIKLKICWSRLQIIDWILISQWTGNQMAGFYMKFSTVLKWVKLPRKIWTVFPPEEIIWEPGDDRACYEWVNYFTVTHFGQMFAFSSHWKHHKISDFLMFSGGM